MSKMLIRIALALVLLELAGHTWLIFAFVPKHGAAEEAVVAAMKSREFSFSGSYHSYWDMYFGYELFVSLSLVMEAGILWNISNRATVGVLALGEIGYAILMYKYFFVIPIASHATMAILLTLAWFMFPVGRGVMEDCR